GQQQSTNHVVVQVVQVLCERPTLCQIQTAAQLGEQSDATVEQLRLRHNVAALDAATCGRQPLHHTVHQHQHELVRIGGGDALPHVHALVRRELRICSIPAHATLLLPPTSVTSVAAVSVPA